MWLSGFGFNLISLTSPFNLLISKTVAINCTHVGFEVITSVAMNSFNFLNKTPCNKSIDISKEIFASIFTVEKQAKQETITKHAASCLIYYVPLWFCPTFVSKLANNRFIHVFIFRQTVVFTAVTLKNAVFWDVTPCRSCVNRCFGGKYRLHLQGRGVDGNYTFLRNVGSHKIYTASHPRRRHSSNL
jgi:hypothetical protein